MQFPAQSGSFIIIVINTVNNSNNMLAEHQTVGKAFQRPKACPPHNSPVR